MVTDRKTAKAGSIMGSALRFILSGAAVGLILSLVSGGSVLAGLVIGGFFGGCLAIAGSIPIHRKDDGGIIDPG